MRCCFKCRPARLLNAGSLHSSLPRPRVSDKSHASHKCAIGKLLPRRDAKSKKSAFRCMVNRFDKRADGDARRSHRQRKQGAISHPLLLCRWHAVKHVCPFLPTPHPQSCLSGVLLTNKRDWSTNTDALIRKGQSRPALPTPKREVFWS